MSKPTANELAAHFQGAFDDAVIEVIDDSHLHAGHAGAASGGGHYTVKLVSESFAGMGTLARHRLVYDSVRDWMPDRIHALSIEARTPAELNR